MVGIGIILLATAITGAVLRWRGRLYETRWFQLLAMAVTPLGFLAVLAGWTTTETGRQPFVIYEHLRTADAVAPVSAGAVTTTLLIFFAVYNVLLIAFFWFAARIALKGPTAGASAYPRAMRPGLDRSGPTLAGADAAEPPLAGLAQPGE
jgi:cytochrome d ubiquinol oxidase subunit I